MVDDKYGAPADCLLPCLFNLMAAAGLLFMTRNNIALITVAAVGIAGMIIMTAVSTLCILIMWRRNPRARDAVA